MTGKVGLAVGQQLSRGSGLETSTPLHGGPSLWAAWASSQNGSEVLSASTPKERSKSAIFLRPTSRNRHSITSLVQAVTGSKEGDVDFPS